MIKILILFALLFNHSFLLAQQATLVEVDKIIIEELNQTVPIIGSIECHTSIDGSLQIQKQPHWFMNVSAGLPALITLVWLSDCKMYF